MKDSTTNTAARELLDGIEGDYAVCMGVSEQSYRQFCDSGALGRMPNDTWAAHCHARKAQIDQLRALLAKSAAYEALVAELATERDLHNRIARNFDHYSKEWVALKDAVDAAPVAMTDGYAVWTTEGMEDLPDWRRKVRVRLLLVREGGDGK